MKAAKVSSLHPQAPNDTMQSSSAVHEYHTSIGEPAELTSCKAAYGKDGITSAAVAALFAWPVTIPRSKVSVVADPTRVQSLPLPLTSAKSVLSVRGVSQNKS